MAKAAKGERPGNLAKVRRRASRKVKAGLAVNPARQAAVAPRPAAEAWR